MIYFPPCKINLGLNIIAKRADGYHDIETCFYPVPWTDILEIIPAKEMAFSCSGLAIAGRPEDNLCLKAYQLLRNDFNLPPVSMHLHKIIPTGAGLGGGSSDAADTLKILNSIFNIQLTKEKLIEYASLLGSDCSFFIEAKPMLGQGRGEILNAIKVDLSGYYLVLIKPEVHISTAEAYAGVVPRIPSDSIETILKKPILEWKHFLSNDFEESVFRKQPSIAEIKNKLYEKGALYASMSGSGSSVFGVFNNNVDLSSNFKGAIYWQSRL